jgi:hypothetical protein
VDTGLAVIATQARLGTIEQLTYAHLVGIYGDGRQISFWNSHLKSFSLVLGTNNPLFQSSYGYQSGIGPSKLNQAIYRSTLRNFLAAMIRESGPSLRCEACGAVVRFDFRAACSAAVESTGQKPVREKWLGRDWFPLIGSMGSDAQALPAASRAVNLCAKCLFAVHYLPLGVVSLEGRLTAFQSQHTALWYALVQRVVELTKSRLSAGEYATVGGRQGSRGLCALLVEAIKRLQQRGQILELPSATSVAVWSFANSSPAECRLEEISNPVLTFLWDAVRQGFDGEVESLLNKIKKEDVTLLESVHRGQDYWGIYPRARWQGASPRLFAFYQRKVCKRRSRTLVLARALARQYAQELIGGWSDLDSDAPIFDSSLQNRFRELIVRFALAGDLTLADYLDLFPSLERQGGMEVLPEGWNILRYYLHRSDDQVIENREVLARPAKAEDSAFRYYAARIMDGYLKQAGKKRLLTRITRAEVSPWWVKQQFVSLAESEVGFTYGAWKKIFTDQTGRLSAGEPMFQMRLLWSEWLRSGKVPKVPTPNFSDETGLPGEVVRMLTRRYEQHIQEVGRGEILTDDLARLRGMEIGLEWFHHEFIVFGRESTETDFFSEIEWERFLRGADGESRSGERSFQMRLVWANLYRESAQRGKIKVG